jgi:hypothetical protein
MQITIISASDPRINSLIGSFSKTKAIGHNNLCLYPQANLLTEYEHLLATPFTELR